MPRAIGIIALLLAGCASDFEKASLVAGLRVLAITAEPPTASPTDLVQFTPLVHPGTDVTFTWSLCALAKGPTTGYECAVDEVPLGATPTTSLAVATLVKKAQDVADTTGATIDLEAGVTVYARLKVATADDTVEAVKRLTITTAEPRNRNPALSGLKADGKDWTAEPLVVEPSQKVSLTPRPADGAAETWDDDGDQQTEELLYAWFATAGAMEQVFSYEGQPDNAWTAPELEDEDTKDITLWVVVRDGRGGTAWLERTARVTRGSAQ